MKSRKLIALFCMMMALMAAAGPAKKAMAAEATTEAVTEAATDTEAITETAEETKTETDTTAVSEEKEDTEETTEKRSYTKKELRLMAAIIFCEAGNESYKGKLAVGSVIMNRVESDDFPDTVKKVIYQKNQFGPVKNGRLAKALKQYDEGKFTTKNHKQCIKAAKAVLSGENSMPGYLYFNMYSARMAKRHPDGVRIKNQWFHKTF